MSRDDAPTMMARVPVATTHRCSAVDQYQSARWSMCRATRLVAAGPETYAFELNETALGHRRRRRRRASDIDLRNLGARRECPRSST